MQIEYVVTKSKRIVSAAIGERLVKIGIARRVESNHEQAADVSESVPAAASSAEPDSRRAYQTRSTDAEGVSAEKPKRKRTYKRKDMQAE